MSGRKMRYKELSKAKIQDTRNLVISSTTKNGEHVGYTLAQQLVAYEGNRRTYMYMSGSLILDDINAMKNLRDALNIAIAREEQNVTIDDDSWEDEWKE